MEIKLTFINFIQTIEKEFDHILRDTLKCTGGLSCQELVQHIKGTTSTYFAPELLFVILCSI